MASKTEIANLALSHIGSGKDISNLDTESSAEARTCRRFYDLARQATLRDFPWAFAGVEVALAVVQDNTATTPVATNSTGLFAYYYRQPSDCLKIRRISNGLRIDTRQSRTDFKVSSDAGGKLIFVNVGNAWMEYTTDVTDTTLYPPDFTLAFSYRLASLIAPRITAGDPFKLGEKAWTLYQAEISRAKATSANEEQMGEDPESQLIREREGGYDPSVRNMRWGRY